MKISALRISYNPFTFVNDGVAPQSFGGVVEFEGTLGKMQARLSDTSIHAIFALVAKDVASAIKGAAAQITEESIATAGYTALTYVVEHIEEGEIV